MTRPGDPKPFDLGPEFDGDSDEDLRAAINEILGPAPHAVNWRTLEADQAEKEWRALDDFVEYLRHRQSLPPQVIPPLWHRHPELVDELSALHTAWDAAHDRQAAASAPLEWNQKWELAQLRLRRLVAESGSALTTDRPTRQYQWPGEDPIPETAETRIADRRKDFEDFVRDDVERRARRS